MANFRISAGMKKTTVIRLNTIPFASTRPKSKPTVNFMDVRAKNPTTVVRLLANMELIASSMAVTIAASSEAPRSRSRENASKRKIE